MIRDMDYGELLSTDTSLIESWNGLLVVDKSNTEPHSKTFAADAPVLPFLQAFEDLQYGGSHPRPEDHMSLVDQIDNDIAVPKIVQVKASPQLCSHSPYSYSYSVGQSFTESKTSTTVSGINQKRYCERVARHLRTVQWEQFETVSGHPNLDRKNPFADDNNDITSPYNSYHQTFMPMPTYFSGQPIQNNVPSLREYAHITGSNGCCTPEVPRNSAKLGPWSNFSCEVQKTPESPTPLPRVSRRKRALTRSDDSEDENYVDAANERTQSISKKRKLEELPKTPVRRKSVGTRSSRRLAGLSPSEVVDT